MRADRRTAAEFSRRELLQRTSAGMGSVALSTLLSQHWPAQASPVDNMAPRPPHFPARAKSIIFLHMVGAPSQLDLFDYKPKLQRYDGQLLPDELWEGLRLAFIRQQPKLLGTAFRFQRCGNCGTEMSELLPHLGQVADEIAVIKSVHTEQFNHAPAQLMVQTGSGRFGRPSLGSWTSYGLGTENRNVPSFVVLISGQIAGGGNSLWGSGFLPSVHQGIELRSKGDPVLFLSNPEGLGAADRGRIVESINVLNRTQLADVGDPEIATRISQYELAFRMQTAVPELLDISSESRQTHDMYGTQVGKESFANNCLLARRLVERGVRFVQLYDSGWDHHGSISSQLPKKCRQVDRPIAALIKDLKQRGLLDQTLVVWGAEFGRTPMLQGESNDGKRQNAGRDHHKDAYTVWMAGGGIRGGITYGRTDDIGFRVAEDPMHINDLHATVLHALGLDHQQLTFRFQGRDFRLTDVGGVVAGSLFA